MIAARREEFELEACPPVWHRPGIRTKSGQPLDVPLPAMAVEWLLKLKELACNAEYVLSARKLQSRMVPHVCESTLGVVAALGVEPHVAERCPNHKLKGVEGVYDRHDYFEERRRALEAWGQLLLKLERQEPLPQKPAAPHQQTSTAQEA